MPFVFSDEEISALAERLAVELIPMLTEALKKKATIKANSIPPNLMPVEELCERLQVSAKWIYRKNKEGVLPGKRVGKFIMFERNEIEAMLREGRLF